MVDVRDNDVSAFTLDIKFFLSYMPRFVSFIFISRNVAVSVIVAADDKQTRYDVILIYCFVVQLLYKFFYEHCLLCICAIITNES